MFKLYFAPINKKIYVDDRQKAIICNKLVAYFLIMNILESLVCSKIDFVPLIFNCTTFCAKKACMLSEKVEC